MKLVIPHRVRVIAAALGVAAGVLVTVLVLVAPWLTPAFSELRRTTHSGRLAGVHRTTLPDSSFALDFRLARKATPYRVQGSLFERALAASVPEAMRAGAFVRVQVRSDLTLPGGFLRVDQLLVNGTELVSLADARSVYADGTRTPPWLVAAFALLTLFFAAALWRLTRTKRQDERAAKS